MKKYLLLLLAVCMLLSACGSAPKTGVHYETSDYVLELPWKDDFRILQLTDLHLANKDNRQKHYDFLDSVIARADADLIVFTGDIFTFADRALAKEFCVWADSHGIPWTLTFGNHDEQCYFSIDWLTGYLNSYGKNCLFRDLQDDDIYGNANFAINLTEDEKTVGQVILMDSNRYNFGEYQGYDYLKDDQIRWYERLVRDTAENNGRTVPSLLFFHIPVPEFADAWDAAQKRSPDAELLYGEKREKNSVPQINTGFFDKVLELGSSRAICVGHDHINDFCIRYKGVYLNYGITSTDRIYYDADMLGGKVITLNREGEVGFEAVLASYEEVNAK